MNARVVTRAFVFQKLTCARRLRASAIAIVTFGVVLAACGTNDTKRPPPIAQSPAGDTVQPVEVGGEVANADSTALSDDQVWITDGNVLALLGVMNARQIAAADVELEAWHTDTVRTFASSVAHDHAALQHSVDSLAARLKVAPVVSALVQRIDTSFRVRVDSLRAVEGRPLERAFVHQQVVAESAYAIYADQLTGASTAPELRSLLESAAARARADAGRARSLEAVLVLADSLKKAAVADSIAQAEARRAARAEARRRRSGTPP